MYLIAGIIIFHFLIGFAYLIHKIFKKDKKNDYFFQDKL